VPTLDELGLYYEQAGEGQDILFLHTWSLSLALWKFQMADLASDCRVTALDFRGHGHSHKPPQPLTMDGLTEDLNRFVERLDVSKFVLVGWGTGGLVSLHYMVKHPSRVRGLVLVGCAPTAGQSRDAELDFWPEGVHRTLTPQLGSDDPDALVGYVSALFHQTPTEATVTWVLDEARKAPPHVRAQIRSLIQGIDFRPSLRAIRVPTLVCHGEYDRLAPIGAGRYLAQAIPRASLVEFSNSGHTPHLEELNKFNEELIAFVEACRGTSPV